jgi:hypothetical protein
MFFGFFRINEHFKMSYACHYQPVLTHDLRMGFGSANNFPVFPKLDLQKHAFGSPATTSSFRACSGMGAILVVVSLSKV